MSQNSPTAVAFYLPQFHPIPENDAWWGKGFTEWTNVTKAKPLFQGHLQPFLPADLGFYDLRVPEVRQQQADLAREAGISAFAYWHYWFGNGRRLLERPLKEVLHDKKPDFPFCLAWANETWSGRWHGLDKKILIEQTYPGENDVIAFFYDSLQYFLMPNYFRFKSDCIFLVYRPNYLPNPSKFIDIWRRLGHKEGITFHFIGIGDPKCVDSGFDAWLANGPSIPHNVKFKNIGEKLFFKIIGQRLQEFFLPNIPQRYSYAQCVKELLNEPLETNEYPLVIPNWDNTPRSGKKGLVLTNSTPIDYEIYLTKAINLLQGRNNNLLFIKSWNEWAEGNVLEPSMQWGKAYLESTAKMLKKQ